MIIGGSHKKFFIGLVISLCFASSGWAKPKGKKECEALLSKLSLNPKARVETAEEITERFAGELAGYIKTVKSVPRQSDLAAHMGLNPKLVSQFFNDIEESPKNITDLLKISVERNNGAYDGMHKEIAKQVSAYFKDRWSLPNLSEIATFLDLPQPQVLVILGGKYEPLKLIEEHFPRTLEIMKRSLLKAYAKEARERYTTPSETQLSEALGITEAELEKLAGKDGLLFKDWKELNDAAAAAHPASFKYVLDKTVFTKERLDRLVKALIVRDRFVVTTAVAGAEINEEMLAAILNYCDKKNADVIVYAANMQTGDLDKRLLDNPRVHILTNTIKLNPWLTLNRIKLPPKLVNPLQGLVELGNRGESQIVSSPKMYTKTIPTTDNSTKPHRLMTTGAITHPLYAGKKEIQDRTDEKARQTHMFGALIVEKYPEDQRFIEFESVGHFHSRHIEYIPEKKGFVDLDTLWTANSTEKIRAEALVLGDIHIGDLDQKLMESAKDMILKLRPKRIILHDLFNGHSVSPHDRLRLMTMADKAKRGLLDLNTELSKVVAFVNSLLALGDDFQIVIVPSNHDFWLHRWLQDGQYAREPHNHALGLELAFARGHGKDPFEYALFNGGKELQMRDPSMFIRNRNTLLSSGGIEDEKRVVFLQIGKSLKVGPRHRLVELGLHGHAGANGARGGLRSFRTGNDRAVTAHTHTEARENGEVNVPTMTELVLGYNLEGMSSWVQGMASVGPHGEIQSYINSDGAFYTPESVKIDHKKFFVEGYPEVVPNQYAPDGAGQLDQWTYQPGVSGLKDRSDWVDGK